MYEHHHEPLLPMAEFLARQARHTALALGIVLVSLGIGVLGYHVLGGLAWIDALVNAAMILGGMGPVDPLRNDAVKIFASLYALFSGMVFLAAAGVLFVPILHRLLHRFHLDDGDDEKAENGV